MDQIPIPWLLLAAIVGLLALQTARVAWLARRPSVRARRRARRALGGERDAEALLRRHGYRVRGRQVRGRWRIRVDGEPVDIQLRADFLVSRRGRRLVAEAKTGQDAPRLAHGPTRRQLLEYQLAFGVEGVLLVDPEGGTVREVDFSPPPRRRTRTLPWLLAGATAGATLAWAAIRWGWLS